MPIVCPSMEDQAQLQAVAARAAAVWSAGGLVVIPTETVYGISALATSDVGWAALAALRPETAMEGLTIHIPSAEAARRYVRVTEPMWRRLLEKFWPGPVTLKIDTSEDDLAQNLHAQGIDPRIQQRLFAQGAVSLRCPDHPAARRVLEAAPGPIVAIAAGVVAGEPAIDAAACRWLGARAGLVIDGGRCRYARPSTVVRLRRRNGWPVVMVEQEGVYDERIIRRMARMTILLVCTGNTCRSPMAQALAQDLLAQRRRLPQEELESAGVRVISAGIYAADGCPASAQAIQAMARQGLNLNSHRSRRLTPQMLQDADRVYCMTADHLRAVTAMLPEVADRAMCLDPQGDIMDPIGSSVEEYQRCAGEIRLALMARFKEFFP